MQATCEREDGFRLLHIFFFGSNCSYVINPREVRQVDNGLATGNRIGAAKVAAAGSGEAGAGGRRRLANRSRFKGKSRLLVSAFKR